MMQRVIVIGCPGSGKSTLSIALSKRTGLPLFHLDRMYWNADRTTVDKATFARRLSEALAKDRFIIDGNYGATMEQRLRACDTVIFLDFPTEVCLDGIRARRGKPRPDMPWVEAEGVAGSDGEDAEFMAFIRQYNTVSRPKVLALLDAYPEKNRIILRDRAEADRFLEGIGEAASV